MVNKFAAIGLGALIALSPLAALAQTDQSAPAGAAPAAGAAPTTGTHRAMTKSRSHHHSRSTAHHMHKMGTKPSSSAPFRRRLRRPIPSDLIETTPRRSLAQRTNRCRVRGTVGSVPRSSNRPACSDLLEGRGCSRSLRMAVGERTGDGKIFLDQLQFAPLRVVVRVEGLASAISVGLTQEPNAAQENHEQAEGQGLAS